MAIVTTLTDSNGVTKDICDQTARDSISQGYYYLLTSNNNIAVSTDLNDVTTPGKYACTSSSAASSLANCPVRSAFYMHVEYGTNDVYVVQKLRQVKTPWVEYIRVRDAGTWTSWHLMSSTEV